MKVKSEAVHTCPNCSTDFVDESFKFPREANMLKSSAAHDYEWHKHEPKIPKSRLHDPLGRAYHKILNRFQNKLRRAGLAKA